MNYLQILLVIYLTDVQVSNVGEICAGKFYLHMALPAQRSGKFTYKLLSALQYLFLAIIYLHV